MSWFRKRKHQFRGVLAFLHPQFLHYSQLAAVLAAHGFRAGDYWATGLAGGFCASRTTGYRPEAKGLSPTFEDNQMGLRMTFAIPTVSGLNNLLSYST